MNILDHPSIFFVDVFVFLLRLKGHSILMVYASGIHLDTIFSENNGEYGEFVFLVESVIQGSQETSNVKSNIDENAFWAIIFPELLAN
jgi:hypothetical protein